VSLTQKRLRELLFYDLDAGYFMWLKVTTFRTHPGAIAGTVNANGYVVIGVDGEPFYAHRLAHFYLRGRWPRREIDHRNLDKSDNTWDNIRPATRGENQQNAPLRAQPNSRSGKRGVYARGRRWCAKINVNKRQYHLGTFDTRSQAYAAYVAAKPIYHPFSAA
jgi:hypothetical protein